MPPISERLENQNGEHLLNLYKLNNLETQLIALILLK